jgi:hypothetical protein
LILGAAMERQHCQRQNDIYAAEALSVDEMLTEYQKVGAGAGIDGARSGLWSEYSRLIGEITASL